MRLSILVTLIMLVSVPHFADAQQAPSKWISANLDKYLTTFAETGRFHGNILVARGNEILLQKSYNMIDAPAEMQVNLNSKFIMASVSKVFVKMSILKLAEENKLSLESRLSDFFPDFPRGNEITVEHLIFHRSGLPRELTGHTEMDQMSLDEAVTLAAKETLMFPPGTESSYSNVGYFLLHAIINEVSTDGYPSYTESQILRPAGLKNTGELRSSPEKVDIVPGFNLDENRKPVPADVKAQDQFETGNYYTTIDDLWKFSQEMFSGKIISKQMSEHLLNEARFLEQAGGRPGYRAYLFYEPYEKITAIFLSNFSDIAFNDLMHDIPAIAAGELINAPPLLHRKSVALAPEILSRYEGDYILDADADLKFTISMTDGQLYTHEEGESPLLLKAENETTFFEDEHSPDGYVFRKNEQSGEWELYLVITGIELKATRQK